MYIIHSFNPNGNARRQVLFPSYWMKKTSHRGLITCPRSYDTAEITTSSNGVKAGAFNHVTCLSL